VNDFLLAKTVGMIVGALTVILSIFIGFLAFVGMGMSNAFNGGYDTSATYHTNIMIFFIMLLLGLVTMIGSFRLKSNAWRRFYLVFCLLMGIGIVIVFFMSFGALGRQSEFLILCVGVIYLLLAYLTKKKK